MLTVPAKLDNQSFKNILSGTKSYIPKEITQELKSAGLSNVLSSKNVTRRQAMKAIKHLQKGGLIPDSKNATSLYRTEGLKQAQTIETARLANQKKMGRVYIAMELSEDQAAYKRQGGKDISYDTRSALGGTSVIDDIEGKRFSRERKVQEEKDKMDKFKDKKGVRGNKPNLVDIDKLPDMDIG